MPYLRTTDQTIYKFAELSDDAKETARDWYREGFEFDYECVIEDAARLADIIGLDIRQQTVKLMNGSTRKKPEVYWSGFCSQGDGASYCGSYSYRKGSVSALAKEAPTGDSRTHNGNNEVNHIAVELASIQKRNFYQVQAIINQRGNYSHSHNLAIDVERADGNPISDTDVEATKEALRDFADWMYRQLEREYEYQTSDEVIDESLTCNDYEFDEEGHNV